MFWGWKEWGRHFPRGAVGVFCSPQLSPRRVLRQSTWYWCYSKQKHHCNITFILLLYTLCSGYQGSSLILYNYYWVLVWDGLLSFKPLLLSLFVSRRCLRRLKDYSVRADTFLDFLSKDCSETTDPSWDTHESPGIWPDNHGRPSAGQSEPPFRGQRGSWWR